MEAGEGSLTGNEIHTSPTNGSPETETQTQLTALPKQETCLGSDGTGDSTPSDKLQQVAVLQQQLTDMQEQAVAQQQLLEERNNRVQLLERRLQNDSRTARTIQQHIQV